MKKILAIIITLTMLLSMLPAFTVSAEEGDGYEYVFTRDVYGAETDVSMAELATKQLSDVDTSRSDPWRPAAHAYIGVTSATSQGIYINSNRTNGDTVYALELKVEEGGTFVPSFTYFAEIDSALVDMFLVKAGTTSGNINTSAFEFAGASGTHNGPLCTFADAITEETAGIYILADDLPLYASTSTEKRENFKNRRIQLDGNSYFLIVRIVGKNPEYTGDYLDTYLKSFSLMPVPGKLTYKFTRDAFKSNENLDINTLGAKTLNDVDADVSAPWRFASDSKILTNSNYTYLGQDWLSICTAKNNSDSVFAIELDDVRTGAYVPTLEYSAYPGSADVNIYLVEEGTKLGNYSTDAFEFKGDETLALNLYLFTHYYNNKLALQEQPGIYVLQENLDMRANGGHVTKIENFENKVVSLNSGKKYYLICGVVSSNTSNPEIFLKSFSLTPVEEAVKEEFTPSVDNTTPVTNSASVKMLAYYGDTSDPIGDVENVTYGESVEIPAPERTVEMGGKTYTFRYWTKGLETGIANRQAISTALSFDYMPHEGANFLIAVYEEEGNAKEAFYNYNGQLLTDLAIVDNKLPLLPSMAGFGSAQKWEQLGTGDLFEENADVTELSGDKVFMAKYGDKISNITINGNTYAYGDPVECKSTDPNFSYWTRTIDGVREIVSVSPNYTFRAFTDCTVEAVCVGKIEVESPCKILLSTFSVGDMTAVMAEFIGFEDAKEKGIMFGTQKIAMTTDYAQFTVTNDTTDDVEVKGYAVVEGERLVSDSITVAGKGSAE